MATRTSRRHHGHRLQLSHDVSPVSPVSSRVVAVRREGGRVAARATAEEEHRWPSTSSLSTTSGCPTTRRRNSAKNPRTLRPLLAEMNAAGVLIFTGGLEATRRYSVSTRQRHATDHGRPVRGDQGAPRRLRRRRCGGRGGGAAVGGEDRRGLRLAAGGTTLPSSRAASRNVLSSAGAPLDRICREAHGARTRLSKY